MHIDSTRYGAPTFGASKTTWLGAAALLAVSLVSGACITEVKRIEQTGGRYHMSGPTRESIVPSGGVSIDLGERGSTEHRIVSEKSGKFVVMEFDCNGSGCGALFSPIPDKSLFLGRLLVNQKDKVIIDTQTGMVYHHSGKIVDKDGKMITEANNESGL